MILFNILVADLPSDRDAIPDTKALTNGSLFHGNFYKYGDMWLALTFWCTISCTLSYLLSGFIASVVMRKSKLSPFIPIVTGMFGMAIGICYGGLAALIISAIYLSAKFLMSWFQAMLWGIGLTLLQVIFAFTLRFLAV
ncbi:hypothetical protein DLAC_11561 [Tieghemostelium lacteum]|uniref:Transmembrane protein n=1 Tax=Tieghemostelium lacteum TaxID=361077 RepID=A0A152A173_TIELA|nr:hypothetical protein DLAC_11561 [Tieghemostelium lacteum]|eukprot:KYQ99820.1 hypothetical protein DLAC_11561 [Tieghemostelium lacteum]